MATGAKARTGHTPGAWKIDDAAASNVLEIYARDGSRHGTIVAQVWDPEGPDGQTEQMWADAHLIAASPSLKDALLGALAEYTDERYDGAPDSGPEPEWVHEAREALGFALVGDRDLRTRTEAVMAAVAERREG